MLHGYHASNFPHLLNSPFCGKQVVQGEQDTRDIAESLIADLHGRPEPSIEGGEYGRGPGKALIVYMVSWVLAGKPCECAKVPRCVKVCGRHEEDLPRRDATSEYPGENLCTWWSMLGTSKLGVSSW